MRVVKIAVCNRKTDKIYKNQERTWDYLKERNANPIRTSETAEEYPKLSKALRDAAKEHGGYVGGWLKEGIRKNGNILFRIIGTLDADKIPPGVNFIELVKKALPGVVWFIHTTHSHTPEAPRYRLVILFNRKVGEDEYPALMRMLVKQIGIDYFDDTTYQANRMMYWASCPSNGEFVFEEQDGAALNPDKYLLMYADWRDVTQWPTSSRESEVRKRKVTQQQDPTLKTGTVGAFCKAYPIEDAIDIFLSDVYEPSAMSGRYDYIPADSSAGVVLYDGKWAYSHHASDPASEKLLNAFDLVRIHKFPEMDEKQSFNAMSEFAAADEKVNSILLKERRESAVRDFTDNDWIKGLRRDKNGLLVNNLHNITLIIENDPQLNPIVFNQLADGLEIRGEVPWKHPSKFWRDADDAQLISYVDSHYGTFSARNYEIAITKVADDRSYHPIREYLDGLPPWDNTPRLDTLYIDYLGAEDNAYTRAVTRKAHVAAVARVKRPGIKFDSIPVLNGNQGIGKSTLIARLGREWYSDSLSIADMKDKTAAEKLQGNWLLEIGEMAGIKKMDVETVKSFASRTDDKYRASFGRRVTSHPRQCVIFGTTNNEGGFLRDVTGNRRFWPVRVSGNGKYKPWELTEEVIDQIWAEALVRFEAGERLYLNRDLEVLAKTEQKEAMERDEREGLVRKYLDLLLPDNWEDMDIYKRREFISEPDNPTLPIGVVKRDIVTNMEIWCECFCRAKENLEPRDSYAIAAIMERIEGWEKSDKLITIPIYGKQRAYRFHLR